MQASEMGDPVKSPSGEAVRCFVVDVSNLRTCRVTLRTDH